MPKDTLFEDGPSGVNAFRFDDRVADVFEDMINRSVPGYAATLAGISGIAAAVVPEDGRCYDLGSSLGAATLAICHGLGQRPATVHAIDNAPAMIARCRSDERLQSCAQDVVLQEADIQNVAFEPAHLIVMNYTLQFVAPAAREALLQKIYAALQPGGALVLAEKFRFEDDDTQSLLTQMHLDFKRSNDYSDMEIAGKRAALENVLIADTREIHEARLKRIGFQRITLWQATLNFGAYVAFRDA